jgi:hypothetical protein
VILIAALVGAGLGGFVMLMMLHAGMLAERSGTAVFVCAIALFYPIFAAQEADVANVALHLIIFIGFATLAHFGFRRGTHLLAGGLIGHGVLDIGLHVIGAPGPVWWPAFCGAFDIAAGVSLVRLVQTGKATS